MIRQSLREPRSADLAVCAPLAVPDAERLARWQHLGDLRTTWATGPDSDALFSAALNEGNDWHAQGSESYRSVRQDCGRPCPRT